LDEDGNRVCIDLMSEPASCLENLRVTFGTSHENNTTGNEKRRGQHDY
jgi:hypothetical protein